MEADINLEANIIRKIYLRLTIAKHMRISHKSFDLYNFDKIVMTGKCKLFNTFSFCGPNSKKILLIAHAMLRIIHRI